MGGLAYIAGGGAEGLGQAGERASAQIGEGERQKAILEMQHLYQEGMQQKEFGHQEQMLGKEQAFTREQTQQQIAARSGIAKAEMAQKEKLAKEHEAAATGRTHEVVQGRRDVAGILAKSRIAAAGAHNGPKPWIVKNVTTSGFDPSSHLPTTTTKPLLFNPNTNSLYAPVGDKLIRWDSEKNAPAVPPAALNRNVDPRELEALYRDPTGTIPAGYKNSGMTNLEAFEAVHHYIPAGLTSHLTSGGMAGGPATGGAPSGGDQGLTNEESATLGEGDESAADGGAYHEYGDTGPQATDNEQAQ